MTTKHLSGAYPAGYSLDPIFDALVLKPTASVGGTGVLASAAAAVTNLGTVDATASYSVGVRLEAGGAVTNGSGAHASALIEATSWGIEADATASVANLGTILAGRAGVYLADGGTVTNGSARDVTALIDGGSGVVMVGASASIQNFGTIESSGFTIVMHYRHNYSAGASVTNGSETDGAALIQGYDVAIQGSGPLTVANFGTIACVQDGIIFGAGSVTNGSETDTVALIKDTQNEGIFSGGVQTTVANFGTITGGDIGVWLAGVAETLTNGSATDRTALALGNREGVWANHGALVTNFGTIEGVGQGVAVWARYGSTVDNFGTITGPRAVYFSNGNNRLVVEAGSSLIGSVVGGAGTLELAAASGTITGLGVAGAISGGQSGTVSGFGSYIFDAGTAWTLAGDASLATGQSLTVAKGASLAVGGAIANAGTLAALGGTVTVAGAVTGAGVVVIDNGALDFASSFGEDVTFAGAKGTLELSQSQSYGGTISGFSKTGGTVLDLVDIGFVSASEASFSGGKTGGLLTVTDGTHTATIALTGRYRTATFVAASDGHGGTLVTCAKAPAPPLAALAAFASAAASLTAAAAPIHQPAELHGQTRLLASPSREVA